MILSPCHIIMPKKMIKNFKKKIKHFKKMIKHFKKMIKHFKKMIKHFKKMKEYSTTAVESLDFPRPLRQRAKTRILKRTQAGKRLLVRRIIIYLVGTRRRT